jgi:hypothetical protein
LPIPLHVGNIFSAAEKIEALYNTLSLDESDLALWYFVKLLVEKRNNANTYTEGQDILQSALPLL